MHDSPVHVSLEFTPNPNTLKYSVNRTLISKGAVNFQSGPEASGRSRLAEALFGVEGICAVMIRRDFVTVTKAENGDWDVVHKGASRLIEELLGSGEPAVEEGAGTSETAPAGSTEAMIIDILDREIRPAVASDGGDIAFVKYEDGVVYLQMQGACSGCPSAAMTLKAGVETRLKESIPGLKEVVSV